VLTVHGVGYKLVDSGDTKDTKVTKDTKGRAG
jgi:hypothetical protein